MWIFSKEGFFSVVQNEYCNEDELMVRARWKADLKKLSERIGRKAEILEFAGSDYRYRIKVTREEWVDYCAQAANEIDYSNVKGTIAGKDRSHAYMRVWAALLPLAHERR